MPSVFKRKLSNTSVDKKSSRQQRRQEELSDIKQVFNGDDSLLQLHAETTELLKLVQTAPTPIKRTSIKKPSATYSRVTIEVLESDDDEHETVTTANTTKRKTTLLPSQTPSGNNTSLNPDPFIDPFSFDAEEARVRAATDTFLPDTSPSKRAVEVQRQHLSIEQQRLKEYERKRRDADEEREMYADTSLAVINRLEQSAIKIQACSRGYLCRKKQNQAAEAAAVALAEEVNKQWHEVCDVERHEVWYYNSQTGQSQWERPTNFQSTALPVLNILGASGQSSSKVSSSVTPSAELPPLSPTSSRPNSRTKNLSSTGSNTTRTKSTRVLPLLPSTREPLEYLTSTWESDSIAGSTDQMSLYSERLEEDDEHDETSRVDFSRGRRSELPSDHAQNVENGDWLTNDSLFLADGTKNSKLRDTIRNALHVSKFDSISSLIASNKVLRKKPIKGRGDSVMNSETNNNITPPVRGREIVLGKKEAPMFVAMLTSPTKRKTHKAKGSSHRATTNGMICPPLIRDVVDPGFHDDLPLSPIKAAPDTIPQEPSSSGPSTVCFNCWSSSTGRHCEIHKDPHELHKIKGTESALMCSNWDLDQLRRKYRAEEIQEIFMKQNASLRYDKQLKQYVTVVECQHPLYRLDHALNLSWNKTMRRKIHTRAWFRSFIEQLRAGNVPKTDTSTPKLMKLKNTIQNHRWTMKYSESVRDFHPKAPITSKVQSILRHGKRIDPSTLPHDVILIDPAHPQLHYWILITEYTKPLELYKPHQYEVPPKRCVPMPQPSFLQDIPLPVANQYIDCQHVISWFERLSARMSIAALDKALLQIHACTPPRGSTEPRKTKNVTPITTLFATFGRKGTKGNMAIGGLSAELSIHMLVTTYIPAQYGHFVVFERRAIAPLLTKDYDASFPCLVVNPASMAYIFRALEHALNVRRPPCITLSTRFFPMETEGDVKRFPPNRADQTGEEQAHGFRTFWLVDAFLVPNDVSPTTVQPTTDILSSNTTSVNLTQTTHVDRFYPFAIVTTKENTPMEFIHLLWIGQSSRNQSQTFTTLGAQQPGEFMKNSNPNGSLGVCTSVIYRSWAYMQTSIYEEFTTDEGVAYWYDKRTGETFWSRPILSIEQHRGKDGDIDGVIADGEGEVATLGVGVENARYPQAELRKYMTKKFEGPDEKARRIQHVTASARKHEIVMTITAREGIEPMDIKRNEFKKIQVPQLDLKKERTKFKMKSSTGPNSKSPPLPPSTVSTSPTKSSLLPSNTEFDPNTKQLIESITQALGSALPSGHGPGNVDMLQLGIGLGMGLGLRQQQNMMSPTKTARSMLRSADRPRSGMTRGVAFIDEHADENDAEEKEESDDDSEATLSSRSDTTMLSGRSVMSSATSVDVSPSPDELNFLPEVEKAKNRSKMLAEKVPGFHSHPPPGEGTSWVHKPVDASGCSQTAVEGYGGSVHQRVACLPKDFVAAVSNAKTCSMQANYLPVVKNVNQPRTVGIMRPRPALDEWIAIGYSPWSAGRSVFGTQFVRNLMQRPELASENDNNEAASSDGAGQGAAVAAAVLEKKENVSQAVKEAQQLDAAFSLCRHGKFDELERMVSNPDWTLSIDAKDVTGNTLLSIACQNNNKRIAKLCLRRGADINTQNLNGQSLLHYCHEYGFHDLMEYLMEKGAKDDLLNADGLTCYEGLSKEHVDAI